MPQILDGAMVDGPFYAMGRGQQLSFDGGAPNGQQGVTVQSGLGLQPVTRLRYGGGAAATIQQPILPVNGDIMGNYIYQAWDGGGGWITTALQRAVARENHATTGRGTSVEFACCPLGSGSNRESLRVDPTVTAEDVAMRVFDVTSGALKQVTRGAADSGGAGFRLLRIAN